MGIDKEKDTEMTDKLQRIIVSTTTTEKRLPLMRMAYESFAKQSIKPEMHILWLDKALEGKPLPDFMSDGYMTVMYTEDIGPATKILPTIKLINDPEAILVTGDDDFGVHEDWLKDLVAAKNKYPDKAVGYRGRAFRDKNNPSYGLTVLHHRYTGDAPVDILTSNWGCAYYRGMFDDTIHNRSDCPDSKFNDDIWISGWLAKNKIRCMRIDQGQHKLFINDTMGGIRKLWDINERGPYNNNIINYFKPNWAI